MRICFYFRKNNALRAAGNSGHQCQIAAIPAHHFDEESAVMGGYLEPAMASSATFKALSTPIVISEPHRSLSMVEATPTTGKSLLPKCPGSGLRAVSTDHNQRIDVALMKNLDGFPLGLFLLEFFATPAAQKGSAALDDVAYVAEPKLDEIVFEQTGIPVPHADGFPAPVNPGTNDRPHSGIHARCVTSTGKYRDAFHSGFLQSNPGTQSRSHTSARAQNA